MKHKILLLAILFAVAGIMLAGCTDLQTGKEPTGIAIAEFTETEYFLGEQLDLSNAKILVTYADGWSRRLDITADMISGYNPKAVGSQTISINYLGFSTQINIEVKDLTIQSIDAVEVNKTTNKVTVARPLRVVEGGQPDFSNISLRINYESISVITETIVPSMVSGYSVESCLPNPEPYPITITYGGKSTTILVYVIEKSVQQLVVEPSGMPYKLQYFYNNPAFANKIEVYNHGKPSSETIEINQGLRYHEVLDPTGLKITVIYNNGTRETVPYSAINPQDIDISYSFNKASAESPVTITYLNKQVIYYVKVIEPVTTGMEITTMPSTRGRYSFVAQDAAAEAPQGVIIELPMHSPSDTTRQYIVRTPEKDISQDLISEGDTIEWHTGRATVIYDDGTTLANVPLDFNDIVKTCTDFPGLNTALNKTGAFTIKVYYSNSNWVPQEIGIKVVPRAAIKLFLAAKSASQAANKVYYVGDEIATETIKYNVFYDNGTFLFGDMSYQDWVNPSNWHNGANTAGVIEYEQWSIPAKWSIDSRQNVYYDFNNSDGNGYGWDSLNDQMLSQENSHKCQEAGGHSIAFVLDGITSPSISVNVLPLIPVSISLVQDYSYYFLVGSSTLGFFEDALREDIKVFIMYNNGVQIQRGLETEYTFIYKDGQPVYSFTTSNPYVFQSVGSYQIKVSIDEAEAFLPLYVKDAASDPLLQDIQITAAPSTNVYDQFSIFQGELSQFRFLLSYADGTQKVLHIGSGNSEAGAVYAKPKYSGEARTEDDILILCDQNKLGNQEVTFRYCGVSIRYGITVIGRWEKSIQIIKLPQQFYLYGRDTAISLDGLKVRILYNDGTMVEETDFSNPKWGFVYPQLGLMQGEHYTIKTVTIILDGVRQKLKRDYSIELVDGTITYIDFDQDQQITVGYNGVNPVYESLLKEYIGSDGSIHKMLNVSYGQDIDLSSFVLRVHYSYTDASGQPKTAMQHRSITSANINYDKSIDYLDGQGNIIYTRLLSIKYCGKTVPVWLHLDIERTLVGIQITESPQQLNYTVGQNIDLRGGLIKRTYLMGDGSYSYDYIYMTNPTVSVAYNNDAFPSGSTEAFQTRAVTLTYLGYSDSFDVTTYKKLNAELEYVDTVFRYGQTVQPKITVVHSGISGFELPHISWSYGVTQLVDGVPQTVWTSVCPTVPGNYPIKVTVSSNDYYEAYQESLRNLNIMKPIITINGKDFTKLYSEADPNYNKAGDAGYYFFGYTGAETPLVGNDILQIRLLRKGIEAAEDVRYDPNGAILGYSISYELISGNNQNDFYIIDFVPGKLYIRPLAITGSIIFTGYAGLMYDGKEHGITAQYVDSNNMKVTIEQKDIVYTYIDTQGDVQVVQKVITVNGQQVTVNCPPTQAGTYTATISSNYSITGTKSVTFTIES